MAQPIIHLHEMQGLYGPFTIAERVVQKIWLRRDFATGQATVTDGRRLEIRSPGTWNLLGGPDFRGARLRLDDREITGDIEVHFHATDWKAHGHGADPAYDNVVLHVVMFPPASGAGVARRRDGRELPTLVLLPLLHRSMEEYASDDALESLTARDVTGKMVELIAMPSADLLELLHRQAAVRWAMKVRFAALRIGKLGWIDAAHHTALEILGYRRNRAAMLAVAARHPLGDWVAGLEADEVFRHGEGLWQLQGVRPANHPRRRLRQYQSWVSRHPDWPDELRQLMLPPFYNPPIRQTYTPRSRDGGTTPLQEGNQILAAEVPSMKRGARQGGVCRDTAENESAKWDASAGLGISSPTSLIRKQAGLGALRERLSHDLLASAVGGSRLDTLVCDGFLPLMAAATGHDLSPVWFHWYLGDTPGEIRRALRETGVAGQNAPPLCHGWGQGLLGWLTERDARASG